MQAGLWSPYYCKRLLTRSIVWINNLISLAPVILFSNVSYIMTTCPLSAWLGLHIPACGGADVELESRFVQDPSGDTGQELSCSVFCHYLRSLSVSSFLQCYCCDLCYVCQWSGNRGSVAPGWWLSVCYVSDACCVRMRHAQTVSGVYRKCQHCWSA